MSFTCTNDIIFILQRAIVTENPFGTYRPEIQLVTAIPVAVIILRCTFCDPLSLLTRFSLKEKVKLAREGAAKGKRSFDARRINS